MATRPTVSEAQAWNPDALRDAAEQWDAAATQMYAAVDSVLDDVERASAEWLGAAADAARREVRAAAAASDDVGRAVVITAVAAREGAQQIAVARSDVLADVEEARAEGFDVSDDGSVAVRAAPSDLLVALSGGDARVAHEYLVVRAAELTRRITESLDLLGAADADAAADIAEAFPGPAHPAMTVSAPSNGGAVSGWPTMGQARIAEQIAALSPGQRRQLIADFPHQVGNTDGVPWDMRIAANRVNIAQAVLDAPQGERAAFYRGLLGEVDDPGGHRVDRQILAFDPGRSSLIELNGNLSTASSLAVLIPGLNTTIEGSAANTQTMRRFVSATRGEVAAITYLGGPFPHGDNPAAALIDAANPRFALEMAPRLVAFSEDVDRTVDALGRGSVPVTYIGHSYGGSILGTAEVFGLTADRTLYLAAAGAGVGVDDPGDWHNRNPDVERYSMTAPGDFIQAVQGIPGGPHGADPDHMPGVIRLPTGYYDDGRLMGGWQSHSDMINQPSDSWRTILAVITGDPESLHRAG
ncbi:alpha/beta hydrolase family protein [Mycobacterium deserti]|uniref:Alpha/beta hydrolase family protein n=1 Tax=Mycobacterium deserti TaxID=2978347 RepID=A0ABT2MCT7_9MYCO|nr:alpha/beta hydrolase family protein [Mycobacterium deserti]MCT7660087.1 alpha/beta hydrolase family protein [Mycobacterium deserti]